MVFKTGIWGEQEKTRSKDRREYFKKYRKDHPQNKYWVKRKKILEKLGGKCNQCGFNDPRALQIDHINNDGYQERRKFLSGEQILNKVLEDTENRYQLLCANCNVIKREIRRGR